MGRCADRRGRSILLQGKYAGKAGTDCVPDGRDSISGMRFWLLHSGEVPLQDQIVAQVSLGILSGELAPGERLPSVRELARRFHIHSNTVSLAYRRLERELYLECRRGSGMYVRQDVAGKGSAAAEHAPARVLDGLLTQAVRLAESSGMTPVELRARFDAACARSAPEALLLLEPEPELQRIVLAELAAAVPIPAAAVVWPVAGAAAPAIPAGTLAVVRPSKAAEIRDSLPSGAALHVLRINAVPQWLSLWLPAPATALVGVVSHWPPFLEFARTLLVAAGLSADALLVRDATEPGWRNGLAQASVVVCDTFTATLLPAGVKAVPFPILAAEGLVELRALFGTRLPHSL